MLRACALATSHGPAQDTARSREKAGNRGGAKLGCAHTTNCLSGAHGEAAWPPGGADRASHEIGSWRPRETALHLQPQKKTQNPLFPSRLSSLPSRGLRAALTQRDTSYPHLMPERHGASPSGWDKPLGWVPLPALRLSYFTAPSASRVGLHVPTSPALLATSTSEPRLHGETLLPAPA